MGREFELKFGCTPAQLAAIRAQFGDFSPISMETTYFDTPGGSLSAQHITLRRRLENGVSICTVKTPGDRCGRGEWEVKAAGIEEAVPLLCAEGCNVDLQRLTAPGLTAICGARFIRLAKTLTMDACEVELALDQGVLLGGGKETALCEVEVELKFGDEATAVSFAHRLAEKHGLMPEEKSKLRRALDLAKGEEHG